MARIQKRRTQKSLGPDDYLGMPYSRVVIPEEDGTFRAEIFEFPGCIATGDTEVEALESLKDVVLSWLESTLARGQVIPEPMENMEFSGKLVLRLPKSLHKKAARAAEHDGISLNQFIVSSLAEHIGAISVTNPATPMTHVYQTPSAVMSTFNMVKILAQTQTGLVQAALEEYAEVQTTPSIQGLARA